MATNKSPSLAATDAPLRLIPVAMAHELKPPQRFCKMIAAVVFGMRQYRVSSDKQGGCNALGQRRAKERRKFQSRPLEVGKSCRTYSLLSKHLELLLTWFQGA